MKYNQSIETNCLRIRKLNSRSKTIIGKLRRLKYHIMGAPKKNQNAKKKDKHLRKMKIETLFTESEGRAVLKRYEVSGYKCFANWRRSQLLGKELE